MKIEKISDNQIRCTLTKEDLEDRQLKLSELAYGTEKAKDLFRDMMQQAEYQFGFEVDDIPIMIEAIPLNTDCILLIITKVENPEELDTRFSRFSPATEETDSDQPQQPVEGADDILDLFAKLREGLNNTKDASSVADFIPLSESLGNKKPKHETPQKQPAAKTATPAAAVITDITKLYSFKSLSEVSRIADVINGFYQGENTLYRDPTDERYYLFIKKSKHTPEEYNKLCNIFAEYAHQETCTPAVEAFFAEHTEKVIGKKALQVLASL